MSLVDYASSDEDEAEISEGERGSFQSPKDESKKDQPPPLPSQRQNWKVKRGIVLGPLRKFGLPSDEHLRSSHSTEPSVVKLPDASLLLNSTPMSSHPVTGDDHFNRVAAAMAERESRKRDANILASALPRGKVPKGNLPHPKSIPDTVSGLLVPPQLRGRSNVVTEDIGKLFVRRNADPSSQ